MSVTPQLTKMYFKLSIEWLNLINKTSKQKQVKLEVCQSGNNMTKEQKLAQGHQWVFNIATQYCSRTLAPSKRMY